MNGTFQLFHKSTGIVSLTGTYEAVGAAFASAGFPAELGIRPAPETVPAPAWVQALNAEAAATDARILATPPVHLRDAAPVVTPVAAPTPVVKAPRTRKAAAPSVADGGAGVLHSDASRTTGRRESSIVVSDVAVARIARHEELLSTIGIALPPPVYAAGSKVLAVGEDNFRTSRLAWEEQTPVIDGLEGVKAAVAAENRIDTAVLMSSIRMLPNGRITKGMGEGLAVEESGFRHLLQGMGDIFPRALPVLLKAPVELRASFFNEMMERYSNELVAADGSPKTMKLRTRDYNGVRSVFAVTSTTYGVRDADAIATDIIAGLHGAAEDARGTVVYDPETTNLRVNATWHANRVVDFAAGDVFQLGATYSSNDARGGSIIVDGTAWRNRCLNLLIIGEASANLLRRRHRGNMQSVAAEITAKTELVVEMFNQFADSWGVLRNTEVKAVQLWGEKFATVPEALAWAVEHKKLATDIKAAVLTEALLTGWKEEPGNTLADLINAITRSHMSNQISEWQRAQVERAAGELVSVLFRAAA